MLIPTVPLSATVVTILPLSYYLTGAKSKLEFNSFFDILQATASISKHFAMCASNARWYILYVTGPQSPVREHHKRLTGFSLSFMVGRMQNTFQRLLDEIRELLRYWLFSSCICILVEAIVFQRVVLDRAVVDCQVECVCYTLFCICGTVRVGSALCSERLPKQLGNIAMPLCIDSVERQLVDQVQGGFGILQDEPYRCIVMAWLSEPVFLLQCWVTRKRFLTSTNLGRETIVRDWCPVRSSKCIGVKRQILRLRL